MTYKVMNSSLFRHWKRRAVTHLFCFYGKII